MRKLFYLLILCTVFATGCWDAEDVKDLTLPDLEGFDYYPETDSYGSFMSFPLIAQNEQAADVIGSKAKTLAEIDARVVNQSNWKVYFGDLKGFILGKEFAMHGTEMLDVLYRNPMLSLTPYMVVAEGTAEEIIKLQPTPSYAGGIGSFFLEMFRNAPKRNFIPDATIYNFMLNSTTPGFNPVLPVISAQDNGKIKITGAALFKKNKMVAMVSEEEMQVLTWLRGEKSEGYIPFTLTGEPPNSRNQINYRCQNKRKVKARLENGVPVFDVEIQLEGSIFEVSGSYQLAGHQLNLEKAERALAQQVKRRCEDFIQDLQHQYRVDAILMGKYARVHWPELVEQDWDEIFCNSVINVEVKANIFGYGERA